MLRGRTPPEFFGDEVVIGVPAPDAERSRDVLEANSLVATPAIIATRALMETISSEPTFTLAAFRAHQSQRALEALIDIEERSRLLAVAPDLHLSASLASATLRQSAAGAFSRPSFQAPSGPST